MGKDEKTRPESETSDEIKPEVLDVIDAEKRRGSRRRPKDTEAERNKKRLAADALKAIRAQDAGIYRDFAARRDTGGFC